MQYSIPGGQWFQPFITETHNSGWSYSSPSYQQALGVSGQIEAEVHKAFTTGQQIVQPGTQGGSALRDQFLFNTLSLVSFEQNDAAFMKHIPTKRVPSTTIEWSQFLSYGTAGDNFVRETGVDGAFGVNSADESFARQVARIKYMAIQRTISLVASMVSNIASPEKTSEKGATLALVASMNLSLYDGNEQLSDSQFNGVDAQVEQWLDANPWDAGCLFNAAGTNLDKDMMEVVTRESAEGRYGDPSHLIGTVTAISDFQRSLYGGARFQEGALLAAAGVKTDQFQSGQGIIKLIQDKMQRPNRPLVADGPGKMGKPRTAVEATWVPAGMTNPWVTGGPTPLAAGSARFWKRRTLNTDTGPVAAPELPSDTYGGGNKSELQAGTYYYAIAAVYGGLETAAWVYGEAAPGVVTGAATAVTTTGLLPIVRCDIKADPLASPFLVGLGTAALPSNLVKYRVYRTKRNVVPTSLQDFDLLDEVGNPKAGNARLWDNGFNIPGAHRAVLLTKQKNGVQSYFMAELLPLLKRALPNLPMANQFALLAFVAPIFLVPRHHTIIRNIGVLPT